MTLGDEGRFRAVVQSVVESAGFDLEDLTVIAAGRRRLVRVAIDNDDGVDLDQAAEVSRQISIRLDADEAGGDGPAGGASKAGSADNDWGGEVSDGGVFGDAPYTLEVTSPGVGRPLTELRHFRRAAGRLVTLTLADASTLQARILRVDGDDVVVLTGADGLQQRPLPLSDITRAKVEVEFSPPSAQVAELLAAAGAGPATGPAEEGMDAR